MSFIELIWRRQMIKNYFKIALRNIKKHKGYFFINIMGLSLGIASCLIISLWVMDELSYDRYHKKSDRIYRIAAHSVIQNNVSDLATSCAPMAKTLKKEFHEVEEAARIRRFGDQRVQYEDKFFKEKKWFYADNEIFNVFTIPMISGDAKGALNKPYTVVLTKSIAEKYFGDDNPLGKSLTLGKSDYKITGIIEDVPRNSHIHYDFLASMETINDSRSPNFISSNYHTYFVLKKDASIDDFKDKVHTLIEKYAGPQVKKVMGITIKQFYESGGEYEYILQSLTDIHLTSHLRFEHEANGNITYIYIFMIIAIAVLLIACINFVNLASARSLKRAREVGVRKAIGSSRKDLIKQFLTESFFMSLIATGLALILVQIVLPVFNNFTEKELNIPYFDNIFLFPLFIGIAFIIGLLAGIYPAFFLSSFKPVDVLKGRSIRKPGSIKIQNLLVVFQFSVSIILIIGTMVVAKQMNYIQNKNLGFDRDQIILLPLDGEMHTNVWPLKQELSKIPGVLSATVLSNLMGNNFGDSVYKPVGLEKEEKKLIWRMSADSDYLNTYKIKLSQGRFFKKDTLKDRNAVIINEKAAESLGFSNPIGQKLQGGRNQEFTIIGILKNFHFESLQQKIKPLIIHPLGQGLSNSIHLSIRLSTNNIQENLDSIKKVWAGISNQQPFNYSFFNDHFAKIYLKEQKTGKIFIVFTILAIFIACLGLFALSSFVINQSTKEIGIRKVLGATILEIYSSLVKKFIKWALIANIIAWPFAYLIMKNWLKEFAYKTDLSINLFLIAALMTLLIAIVTVTFQSIRAATLNPVEAIRYE